jgi:MFS family permease
MTRIPAADEAASLQRRRVTVLAGSVAMLLISGGGMYLIVVALKEVATEFGWPRAVPSFAFSLQFIGSGFGGIVMGYVLDRYGFVVPALVGTVMVGLGGICGSYIDSAWQLYLIYAFMFGLSGQGSLAAPALANIARWYDRRRGMAVGIASSGQALAGIVWPPIFGYVLVAIGWRDMFFWFGVVAFVLMLPLCIVVRFRPPPYAPPAVAPATKETKAAGPSRPAPAPLTSRAIQTTLCCAIFGCCVAMSLPLGHLVSLVTDRGHPIHNAVEVLSVMLMAAFVSRAVLLGVLSDRLGGLRALIVFSFVQAATLATFTVTYELWALYVVAVLCGLGYGGLFPVYAVVTREHLPIAEVGRRTGVIFLFGAVAMGLGSWMGGYLFDLTGSYTLPFLIGVAFNIGNLVIVGALILRIRPPLPLRLRRA